MSSAAEQAAAVFKANGNTWQERPVKPPPYTPGVEQIDALFMVLLSEVVNGKPNDVTRTVYNHAMSRDLRVVRLTGLKEPEQRFALQVQTQPAGTPQQYDAVAIVDMAGTEAEWVPAPKPVPETKDSLRAKVAELESQLSDLSARVDARGDI